MATPKPRKHLITRLGLFVLLLVVADFLYIVVHQKLATGAFFSNPAPWASPDWTRLALLVGVSVSLSLLLVGSIIDSIRYGRWKRMSN